MISKNKIILSLIFVLVVTIAGFSVFRGLAQSNQDNKISVKVLRKNQIPSEIISEKELDDSATPIADYEDSNSNGVNKGDNRKIKGKRYDNASVLSPDSTSNVGEIISSAHWTRGLSEFPVEQSDLVIVGKIENSKAYLSNDRKGVYSEYYLKISKILRISSNISVKNSDVISIERFGGRVKYPSGKIIRYRVEGQGSPMKGKKYLMFIKKGTLDNYNLLTAYELRGNKIFALDGSRVNSYGQGDWLFDKHNNEKFNKFRKSLRDKTKLDLGGEFDNE